MVTAGKADNMTDGHKQCMEMQADAVTSKPPAPQMSPAPPLIDMGSSTDQGSPAKAPVANKQACFECSNRGQGAWGCCWCLRQR
jgi:hypothetical protein